MAIYIGERVLLYNDYYIIVVPKKNAFCISRPGEGTKIRDQKEAPKNVRVYGEKVLNVVIINNARPPSPQSLQVIAHIYTYMYIYIYIHNICVCDVYSNLCPKFMTPFYVIIWFFSNIYTVHSQNPQQGREGTYI